MFRGLNDVGIAVTDLGETLTFYNKLGLPVERRDGDGRDLLIGDEPPYLYVFETDGESAAEGLRDGDVFSNPPGIDHLTFEVEDVDEYYRTISERGVPALTEPTTHEGAGFRYITVRDPSGNLFYFLTHR